jgi:uncharacterized protein (TIGR02284 family)
MREETGQSVEALNELLRGERSAVETYRQAVQRVTEPGIRTQLGDCQRSHEQRCDKLEQRIHELGGRADETSGAWGTFAKIVQGGAAIVGEKATIAALEEGEDHGNKLYRNDLPKLDAQSRRLVEEELLPEQQRTHDTLSRIKHSMK